MIGIKMDMPKNCNNCYFRGSDYEYRPICKLIKNTKKFGCENSLSYWKYVGEDARERHSLCPLVEIKEKESELDD